MQVGNIRAARAQENWMENTVEVVVKVVCQGQAVPKNRPGFYARYDSRNSSGRRPKMRPALYRRYVASQCSHWVGERVGTV